MEKGQEIQIKGTLGFLVNPTMIVVEVKNTMVKLVSKNAKTGGLLSETNESWYGIDFIQEKLTT